MKRKFFSFKVGEQEHMAPKDWIPDEEKTWLEPITVPWPLHNQVGVLTFELRSNILELLPLQSTSSLPIDIGHNDCWITVPLTP